MALWSFGLRISADVEFSVFRIISLLDESFGFIVRLPMEIILFCWESFITKYLKSFRLVENVHQFLNPKSFSTWIFLLSINVSEGLVMRQEACFIVFILSLVSKLLNNKLLLTSAVLLVVSNEKFWSLSYDAFLLYSSSRSPICLFL